MSKCRILMNSSESRGILQPETRKASVIIRILTMLVYEMARLVICFCRRYPDHLPGRQQ
jgi:hypothetical protein